MGDARVAGAERRDHDSASSMTRLKQAGQYVCECSISLERKSGSLTQLLLTLIRRQLQHLTMIIGVFIPSIRCNRLSDNRNR